MPALDLLGTIAGPQQTAFQAALPGGAKLAGRMPLVRVVFSKNKSRRTVEIEDFLVRGVIRRSHKSDHSRDIEKRLAVQDSLYFHLGRAHPDYGDAAIVVQEATVASEASPFGLGGLLCPGSGKNHDAGCCVSPLAHAPEGDQKMFVASSTWYSDWRAKAGEFLALFFNANADAYFAPGEGGRPSIADPEAIFSDPANKDWRSWTIEVRLLDDLRLDEVLTGNYLLHWAVVDTVENDLYDQAQAAGVPLRDMFPYLERLPAARQIRATVATKSLFADVDSATLSWVKS